VSANALSGEGVEQGFFVGESMDHNEKHYHLDPNHGRGFALAPDGSKDAFLRSFARSGNTVYQYNIKNIHDADKIYAVEQYNASPMNGEPLLEMLLSIKKLYNPKEISRDGGRGHISIDTTVKSIPNEEKRRCGEECSHFKCHSTHINQRALLGQCTLDAVIMIGAKDRAAGNLCEMGLKKEEQ
jgi:hypothetical protein